MKLNIILSLGKEQYGQRHNELICDAEVLPGSLLADRQDMVGEELIEEAKVLTEAYGSIQKTIAHLNERMFMDGKSDEDSSKP